MAISLWIHNIMYIVSANCSIKLTDWWLFVTGYISCTQVSPCGLALLLDGYNLETIKYLFNRFTFGFKVSCMHPPPHHVTPSNYPPCHGKTGHCLQTGCKRSPTGEGTGPLWYYSPAPHYWSALPQPHSKAWKSSSLNTQFSIPVHKQ